MENIRDINLASALISIIILAALIGVWYFLVFIVAAPPEKQEQDLIVPQNIECDIISKNNQEKRIIKSKSYSKYCFAFSGCNSIV